MFHGIAELTIDSVGYVYWKGHNVEHYSHEAVTDPSYAIDLARKCRFIERLNLPLHSGTTVWRWHHVKNFTPGSPYQHLLLNHYSIQQSPEGNCAILAGGNCWEKFGSVWAIAFAADENYQLSRLLDRRGYVSPDLGQPRCPACPGGIQTANWASYDRVVAYLQAAEVPEDLLF